MRQWIAFVALLAAAFTLPAQAALEVEITEGATGAMPIAVVPFDLGPAVDSSVDLVSVINADLRGTGLFDPLPPEDMLAAPSSAKEVIYRNWRAVNVDYLVVGSVKADRGGGYQVRFQILDVYQGEVMAGYRIAASPENMRDVAHTIANKIYETLTGHEGYFRSRIAFVSAKEVDGRTRYRLMVADYDGHNARVLVSSRSPIMSPAWHPAGTKLAYAVIGMEHGRASIRILDLITGTMRVISARPGLNAAPAWSPTGNKLAITLSYHGNPDIYIYNLITDSLRQLTHSPAIDTGATWSPDGEYIAFTSGRGGSPQIYRIPTDGGIAERLTFQGESNQRPVYSPNGERLAMVRGGANGYRIAILNLKTNNVRIVSEGPFDESPSFAPNGQALIFASQADSGDLTMVSLTSGTKRNLQLPGRAYAPAWGPALYQ